MPDRRVACLSGLALALLCPLSPQAQPATPTAVPVARLAARPVERWFTLSAQLEAASEVEIRPRVSGAVAQVHFREGGMVKAGELLVSLDAAPYRAELARAEAALDAAKAQLDFAATQHQRGQKLRADLAIAMVELDRLANAEALARTGIASAQAQVESARLQLGYTSIRAPIAGRVGRVLVTPGNLVTAGAQAPLLTTLVSTSPVYAAFDMDEATLRELLPGTRQLGDVVVNAEKGAARLSGRLHALDNRFNGATGTVRARARFDNAGELMPGQFVQLRLRSAKPTPALLVPESAVGTDQDKRFVYVAGDDNTAVYRRVELGALVDGQRVVTAGLKAGERVLLARLQQIKPGARIAPQLAP